MIDRSTDRFKPVRSASHHYHHHPPPRQHIPFPTQETTVFATAHCPDHRFLLASSNQGRLAVWDLTSYLFPSINTTDGDDDDDEGYVDRPVLNPRGLRPPPRQLQPGQARLHPAALVKQGWPRLSLQVSDRAVNSIAFTSAGSGGKSSSSKSSKSSSSKTGGPSLLVLAGDEGIVVYEWAHFLALLQQDAPPGARTLDFPPPKARLCALPAGAARAWPYLTESNQVALAEGGGRGEAYSAVRERARVTCGWVGGWMLFVFFSFSPAFAHRSTHPHSSLPPRPYHQCGDAAVRCWDLEKGVCTRVLQGHTGYVHTVAPVPGGSGLVLSGACVSDRGRGGRGACIHTFIETDRLARCFQTLSDRLARLHTRTHTYTKQTHTKKQAGRTASSGCGTRAPPHRGAWPPPPPRPLRTTRGLLPPPPPRPRPWRASRGASGSPRSPPTRGATSSWRGAAWSGRRGCPTGGSTALSRSSTSPRWPWWPRRPRPRRLSRTCASSRIR